MKKMQYAEHDMAQGGLGTSLRSHRVEYLMTPTLRILSCLWQWRLKAASLLRLVVVSRNSCSNCYSPYTNHFFATECHSMPQVSSTLCWSTGCWAGTVYIKCVAKTHLKPCYQKGVVASAKGGHPLEGRFEPREQLMEGQVGLRRARG